MRLKNLKFLGVLAFVLMATPLGAEEAADSDLQLIALQLYQRIAGTMPSSSVLNSMKSKLVEGRPDEAAFIALNDLNFYRETLKTMFEVDSNREKSNFEPLNDFTAGIVGLVRNNERFDEVFWGDFIYIAPEAYSMDYNIITDMGKLIDVNYKDDYSIMADPNTEQGGSEGNSTPPAGKVRPLYRSFNNFDVNGNPTGNVTIRWLYTSDEANSHFGDLSKIENWPELLTKRTYSQLSQKLFGNENYTGNFSERLKPEDTAGIYTLRQSAKEYFSAGTNRRVYPTMSSSFLCLDLKQKLHDTSLPDQFVRQDIDRAPGGLNQQYLSQCVGCHSHMDGNVGAFVYFNYEDGFMRYNRDALTDPNYKLFRLADVYPDGWKPKDNSWTNLLPQGEHAGVLGFRTPDNGQSFETGIGAKSLGRALSATKAFGDCMANRVFKQVCNRAATPKEGKHLSSLARDFEEGMPQYASYNANGKYNMRALFAASAGMCFSSED